MFKVNTSVIIAYNLCLIIDVIEQEVSTFSIIKIIEYFDLCSRYIKGISPFNVCINFSERFI